MAKYSKKSEFVKEVKLNTPSTMDFYENVDNPRFRNKFVTRVEKIVRSSLEYKDYIQFLKEHIGLDRCIFFQNITNKNAKHVTIEMHHEPLTLYDIVDVVLQRYIDDGLPIDDLDIADEVLRLHYENKVGLVPLSKTAHALVHNSTKLYVPLNMVYGMYSQFFSEYENYIPEELYDKIEQKIAQTNAMTEESFDAIRREFTYLEIKGFDEIEKIENESEAIVA